MLEAINSNLNSTSCVLYVTYNSQEFLLRSKLHSSLMTFLPEHAIRKPAAVVHRCLTYSYRRIKLQPDRPCLPRRSGRASSSMVVPATSHGRTSIHTLGKSTLPLYWLSIDLLLLSFPKVQLPWTLPRMLWPCLKILHFLIVGRVLYVNWPPV